MLLIVMEAAKPPPMLVNLIINYMHNRVYLPSFVYDVTALKKKIDF